MSHTRRIYNRGPVLGGPGLRGWVMSNLDDPRVVDIAEANYVFSRYRTYCMGHCHHCRDWRLRSRRRAAWKAVVRGLSEEYAFGEMSREFETIDELFTALDDT